MATNTEKPGKKAREREASPVVAFTDAGGVADGLPNRSRVPRYLKDPSPEEQAAAHRIYDLAHALLARGLSNDETARELDVPGSYVARLRVGPLPPHFGKSGREPLNPILDRERAEALTAKLEAERRAKDAQIEAARDRQKERAEAQKIEAQLTKGGRAVAAAAIQAQIKLAPKLTAFAEAIGLDIEKKIAAGAIDYAKDLPILARAQRGQRDLLLMIESMARITAIANDDPALRAATDAAMLGAGDAEEVAALVNLAMSATSRASALREGAVAIGVSQTRRVFAVQRGPVIPDIVDGDVSLDDATADDMPGAPAVYPTELDDDE